MTTDSNICDCGWQEHGDEVNPHRQKCPRCGAPFFEREVTRWFLSHPSEKADEAAEKRE